MCARRHWLYFICSGPSEVCTFGKTSKIVFVLSPVRLSKWHNTFSVWVGFLDEELSLVNLEPHTCSILQEKKPVGQTAWFFVTASRVDWDQCSPSSWFSQMHLSSIHEGQKCRLVTSFTATLHLVVVIVTSLQTPADPWLVAGMWGHQVSPCYTPACRLVYFYHAIVYPY